jgi:hypothetical protein
VSIESSCCENAPTGIELDAGDWFGMEASLEDQGRPSRIVSLQNANYSCLRSNGYQVGRAVAIHNAEARRELHLGHQRVDFGFLRIVPYPHSSILTASDHMVLKRKCIEASDCTAMEINQLWLVRER